MTMHVYSSATQWYNKGRKTSLIRRMKSPGGILDLLEMTCPAGDMSRPALPYIVLYQDLIGGSRVIGDLGGGRFDVTSKKGDLTVAAPNFATAAVMETNRHLRSLVFPMAQWPQMLDEAANGDFSFDLSRIYGRMFDSTAIRSALHKLWVLSDEEGGPSRLLAQAAGCEIFAELCRLSGAPFAPSRGGLAPWAERRCLELIQARFSENISLDEMAAEARLSAFHFARMFKESVGATPRVYLTRLRVEKACELLKTTNLSVTEIALEVGYSSNQVLARVFLKHKGMSPTDFRRATRDLVRRTSMQALETQ